jgi:hypothetical protein
VVVCHCRCGGGSHQFAQSIRLSQGYPKEWIDKRLRGIAVRQDLTDEWKDRGASTNLEFAILTNEIMQGAFKEAQGRI